MLTWRNYSHPVRMAYAAWSVLTESGDGDAHRLIARHGPIEALNLVGSAIAGGTEIAVPGKAAQRWAPRIAALHLDELVDRHLSYGGFLLTPDDEFWPRLFADLGDRAPFALWARGKNLATLMSAAPHVSIVGARAATTYGLHMATELASHLATLGHTIVSGGAFGIDGAAHRGALAVDGPTVAILAGGPDRFYPAAHTSLLEAIESRGLIISEHPPGRAPSRFRFLERNRLIAALGAVTIVVQAALRSGALRTARDASELGRHVAAIPGPVTDMASAGCHEAIRSQLAVLVTDADEVRELIAPIGTHDATKVSEQAGLLDGLEPHEAKVLDVLPPRGSYELTRVAEESALSIEDARAALGMLTLAGKVEQVGHAFRRS